MEVAALALNIDSSGVVKASKDLDKFAVTSDRAGSASTKSVSSTAKMAESYAKTAKLIDQCSGSTARAVSAAQSAAKAQASASAATRNFGSAVAAANAHVTAYRGHLATIPQAMNKVGASTGAARAGMQQLSFQLGDMATMWSMNAPPMQIFASQASQVVGALGLMTAGSKGFLGFLGGPWGQVIIGAVTVLGTLGTSFLATGDKAQEGAKGVDRMTASLRNLAAAQGRVTAIDLGNAQVTLSQQQGHLARLNEQIAGAQGTRAEMQRRAALVQQRDALQGQIAATDAIVKGSQRRWELQLAAAAAEERGASAAKAGKIATREHAKELREAESAAKAAARAAESLAKWIAATRSEAQGHVQRQYSDMVARQQDWKDELPSFMQADTDAMEAAARVREGQLQTEYRLLGVYLDQVDAIRQMGGAFDTIGGIVQGIATGNFRGIGGKLGGILGTIGGMDTGVMAESEYGAAGNKLDKPERIGTTIADHLTKVFRDNGPFFQGFKTLLANAAIGSTAAGLTGGSKLGGAIGGALGGKAGSKLLAGSLESVFKGLGDFAGPLGSMLGGVVGGLVGSAFKKAKYGTATITMDQFGALDSSITSGRGSAQKAAATSAANGVIRSITDITSALGATISGIPNLTVGTYKDSYRVSTTGRTGKIKGKYADVVDFGKDGQEAAIAYAVQLSLERGVITGISQASINILKSGQDLQKAIEKATLIESIPKDLQKLTDPLGYAINEVNDKFAKIVAALKEGGASAEQMAQAQLLYNLEMADAKASTNSAAQAMKDFLKSLNVGSSSPLSLRSQAETAQAMLDPYLAQINAGQTVNQEKYLAAAQTYLDVQRQIYGSTSKYFEAFDMIQAATSKAIGTAENVTPIRTTSDPFIEQTANATKALLDPAKMTAANTANLNERVDRSNQLMEQMLDQLSKMQSNSFIGSARNYS